MFDLFKRRMANEPLAQKVRWVTLRAALPKMRFEALLGGFSPLLRRAAHDAHLAQLLDRFADIPEYNEAVAELKDD